MKLSSFLNSMYNLLKKGCAKFSSLSKTQSLVGSAIIIINSEKLKLSFKRIPYSSRREMFQQMPGGNRI